MIRPQHHTAKRTSQHGRLSAAERDALPASAFALPGRRYPIHNINHARAALSDVARYGTPAEQAKVRAKVHAAYPGIAEGQ